MKSLVCLLILMTPITAVFSQNPDLSQVLIITTGGTIASRTNAPLVEGPQLVQAVPQLADIAVIDVEEFVRVGSSKMTPDLWLGLAQLIHQRISERPDLDGIVITHGTDTMEETAFFLNCVHKHDVPIVLVGSMRSSNMISADGPANLLNATQVAVSPKSAGKGVLVVMNDNISAARDLTKAHNTRVDAFVPTDKGYIGAVRGDRVTFFRTPTKKHTTQTEFDIYTAERLPTIDIVQDFAGFDGDILSYFLARDNEGLIITSFAGGRMSHGMDSLAGLPADHKPIVIASGIKGGAISGSNSGDSPIVISPDLPANKARILLMLALTKTQDAGEIQRIFEMY